MTTSVRSLDLWQLVAEHGAWVLAAGLLVLAPAYMRPDTPYPTIFTVFLIVVLLIPVLSAWNCLTAASCAYINAHEPIHVAILFLLMMIWLIGPMALVAVVFDPRWRLAHPPRGEKGPAPGLTDVTSRGILIRVSAIAVTMSMLLSTIGGANSFFWTEDVSLGGSLFINALFVLPIALLPLGAMALRRGIVAAWRRCLT